MIATLHAALDSGARTKVQPISPFTQSTAPVRPPVN
jgi:hypothetical protein